MDQAITRATGAAPRAVGEFQGYVDGVDGIKPSVRWLDRKNMPQVGDKLFVLPCGAAAGGRPARTWSILLTSGNRGLAAPVGHAFGTEGEKYERVQVMEIVEAGSPPAPGVDLGGLVRLNAADVLPGSVGASTVLTDERIEAIWCREAGEAEAGKRRIAFARAIEREVAAQAGQVAVSDDVARDAARWRFMMRVADDADGLEAQAMESLGNEQMETDRPESEQMCELVDQAIAKVAAPSPAKESK